MSFDATTFVLEIINFVVLLWLLQKFLYKPILDVINKRQAAVEKRVSEARQALEQAQALEQQYNSRLSEWEKEKQRLKAFLGEELKVERQRQLAKVKLEIDQEQARAQALAEAKRKGETLQYEQLAIELAAKCMANVLSRFASSDLERRICEVFLTDLSGYEKEQLALTMNHGQSGSAKIQVATAYPAGTELKESIIAGLKQKLGQDCELEFLQDSSLIAGIKVTTAGGILQANLSDVVQFFRGIESNGAST